VSEALFRAEDLTPEGCERVAQTAGVDLQAYRACLASPRPNVALERDDRAARDAGVSGLPTLWVGREQFVGLQTVETLRASIDRALRNSPRRGT
jgi:predicted DsbA family dithiol-disulfide isomerase